MAYISPAEGEYDMDGDGKADLLVSSAAKPASWKGNYKQIGKDITLTGGSEGMIHALPNLAIEWNEERDYLWPIPASERVLSGVLFLRIRVGPTLLILIELCYGSTE